MYYLIETQLLSANADRNLNNHRVEIRTQPAVTNMSNEIMLNGWCGTSNDLSTTAHGEYELLTEAQAALDELFGPVRPDNHEANDEYNAEFGVVEYHLVGEYTELTEEQTHDYISAGYLDTLTGKESEGQLFELEIHAEGFANSEGYTLFNADTVIAEARNEARRQFYMRYEDAWCEAYPSAYAHHAHSQYYWIARGVIDNNTHEVVFYWPDDDGDPDTYDWADCIESIQII